MKDGEAGGARSGGMEWECAALTTHERSDLDTTMSSMIPPPDKIGS